MKKRRALILRPSFSMLDMFDRFERSMERMFEMPDFSSIVDFKTAKIDTDEKNVLVSVDIPGFEKSEIKIDIDGRLINIVAKKESDKERKSVSYTYSLPSLVDIKDSKAKYENGVLKLTLPKIKEVEAKNTIAIE